MAVWPSGQQWEIRLGKARATIVEVGGGVREYYDGDVPVLHPYDIDQMCDGAHGCPLIPWPNRLADGRYEWDGRNYQVPLTEPEKDNAIHGFLRWQPWALVEQADSRVVVETQIFPRKGYPFTLHVNVEYELTDSGLVCTTTATNLGTQDLPYAHGQHPYLSPGDKGAKVDDCTLTLEANKRVATDKRQLPTDVVPVEGTEYDFRQGRSLKGLEVDYAFTDLTRDADGLAWIHLDRADNRRASLWADEHYPYLEIYTSDTLSGDRQRAGLGSEPMTAPPNAFQSGSDVIRLAPEQSVTTRWGAQLQS
ncbi:MAG: aldose 1-epimerase family protein [Actinomycetes bacterium]